METMKKQNSVINENELATLQQILSDEDFEYVNENDSLYMNYLRLSGEGIFDGDYNKFCKVINEF